MLAAQQLHLEGVAAINAGRVRRARTVLERAHALVDHGDLRARIEASLAYVAADTGEAALALELCSSALREPDLSAETRGVVQGQRALLLMRAGETASALAAFDEAIGALAETPSDLGKVHLNRGGVYLQQGRTAQAARDFSRAVEELESADHPIEAAMARHNLGYSLFLEGDLVGALRAMDAARVVLAPLSPVSQATCDQDRAEVLMAAGLVAEGRAALRAASRAYGARRLGRRRAEAELVLARSLLLDDPRSALVAARTAARLFGTTQHEAWAVRARAVALAAEVELGRRSSDLLARSDALAGQLESQGVRWPATLVRLYAVRVAAGRGDIDRARERLRHVRTDSRAPLAVRLLDRDVRAEVAVSSGRRSAALRHLDKGLTNLHEWQSSFGDLDLQTLVTGRGRRLAVRGLSLALDAGDPELVFAWSERARMLASRVQPVRSPVDAALAADLAEVRRSTGAQMPAPPRDAELRRRVRERAWQRAGSGEVADPCDLADLRAALGSGTALVAHVAAAGRLVAVVVTDEGVTGHELGSRAGVADLLGGLMPDLDVAATDLPDPMAGAVRAELAARLRDLDDVLVVPLLPDLGDREVVLTPSGLLAGMPWPLLPGLVGRPVTVAQSATTWLGRRTTPLRVAGAGFVAGPRVARAEQEVRAAARAWPGAHVLTGSHATVAAVSELAARVDVLHLAAHGRHSSENPMFSGLELVDGPWFGYDIDQLTAVPDVVLLSACELGRSSVRWGEELIGMTTAWLHAGTRCVIAATAAVSDDVACDVLVRVHAGLGEGATPAAALAAAVSEVGPHTPPTPFVCFGNS